MEMCDSKRADFFTKKCVSEDKRFASYSPLLRECDCR